MLEGGSTPVAIAASDPGIGKSTMPGLLAEAAARYGQAPWLTYDGETRSFVEFNERANSVAAALIGAGLRTDDGVALFAGNGFDWLQIEMGVAAAGAWMVPLNTWFRTAELTHILRSSGCRALVWESKVLGQDMRPLLQSLIPDLDGGAPGKWRSEAFPDLELVVGLGDGPWPSGVTPWEQFQRGGQQIDAAAVRVSAESVGPEDKGLVIYTSGTTGAPKGAILTQTAIVDHMREWTRHMALGPADRSIMASPLFWVFGCTMNAMVPLLAGSMTVLEDRFAAAGFLADIERYGCTHLQGVPEQYELALNHADAAMRDLSTLSVVQIGGSKTVADLAQRIREHAPEARMLAAYGLTEAVGVNTWTDFDDDVELLGTSIGHASPDNEIVLRDTATFEEVETGELGEICIRGHHVSPGYLGDLAATAEAFVDGWLRTGDLAKVDERGYYEIMGRRSHTYKRGSMNVYPAETEVLLGSHPAVERAAVVGVPDQRLGEAGAAFVILTSGGSLTEGELLQWCEGRIARYKVPAHVRFVDTLPITASGKVRKFELQEAWKAEPPPVA